MRDFDIRDFLISMFVLVISVTVHELAHALSARSAGDDTAERAGRISINPLDHLDPMGTIMMIVTSISHMGIGWAKPVPVNPMKFRHPRWDNLKVSLWGPLSNLLIALVFAQMIRFGVTRPGTVDDLFVFTFVWVNLSLAIFNLIPVAPLDGSHILSSLLPVDQARQYDIFMGRYGFMILLALVFLGPMMHIYVLNTILGPPVNFLYGLFTGVH